MTEDHPAYQAGYRTGKRHIADIISQGRVGIQKIEAFDDVETWDMTELAAAGYLPVDLIEQIEERVDPAVRAEFAKGLVAACQDHVARRDLELGDN